MATFEEKILAYLDGSLSGDEREDVRRRIASGDAHATRLLDAHVRLGGLYALAAKPISAPLTLQCELASKVPVLARKLPYLAMPEKRRKRAAGWLWELTAFRMNAMLLLLAALLAGGIWFAISGGHTGQSGFVSQKVLSQPVTTDGPSVSGKAPRNTTSPTANNAGVSTASHFASFRKTHAFYGTHGSHSVKFQKTSFPQDALPQDAAVKELSATPQPAQAEPASAEAAHRAALAPHTIEVSELPAQFHAAGAIPIPVTAEQENSYTPVRVFLVENDRVLRLSPQAHPSDFARHYGLWQSSVTTESPELGIDYEVTPWVAFGLRVGGARFIQEQQILHMETRSGSYSHLTSAVIETALLDPFAPWACAAATYTPNPGERLQYSFTAAAGDVFVSGFSPTVLGEAAAVYKVNDAIGLRASFSYQAAWVTSANPILTSAPQVSSNVSGSSIQSVTTTSYPSQSLGFSLGVTFHP